MIKNNKINFAGQYHFLQKQSGLPCAYCGKTIITNTDIKTIQKSLEGKKGIEIAEILEPYVEIFEGKGKQFITELVHYAKEPKYKDWKFKQLSMLCSEEKIFENDIKKTIENLFHSIKFSVEHTTPKTLDGGNTQTNYLPMHIYCNEQRKHYDYAQMSLLNPDFTNNIRKSLLEIKYRVEKDKLGKPIYNIHLPDNYFVGIKENIAKQGLGEEYFADI